jgi:adenylylsulfate kinase
MQKGFTIWFTGLSGSGKTTISKALAEEIKKSGRNIEVLDGDVIRTNLSKGLGFSKEDRDINIRRIGFVAHLLTRNGVAVICAAISPYQAIRDENRKLIGDFIEVYVKASVETCAKRDVKGLYQKAFAGEIKEFTGVSDPYEAPENPEVICETEKESVEQSTGKIVTYLEEKGYL